MKFLKRHARQSVLCAAAVFLGFSGSEARPTKSPVEEFHADILPMLEKHCYECHGDGYDKGKVAFDGLDTDAKILDESLWLRVLNNTRAGLMPAERKPRLSPGEQARLEHWIKYSVFRIDPASPDPGRVTVRRLNRIEYRNTIRDLMGVDFKAEEEFPPDDTGYGFDNIGDALTLSPMLMEKYVAAAQEIVKLAVPQAPLEPDEHAVKGAAFEFQGERVRKSDSKLAAMYYSPAGGEARFTTAQPGTYKVIAEVAVDGSFIFDAAKAHVVLTADGKTVVDRDFGYFNEREFTFEQTFKWKAAGHVLRFDLKPLTETTPEEIEKKLKDPLEFVVKRVRIVGPLEPKAWVPPDAYARFFPRAAPPVRAAERLAYAREVLAAFAAKAYRRPLEAGDDSPDRLAQLAQSVYSQRGKTFEQGVAHAMAAVIASPRFLFRLEQPADAAQAQPAAPIDEYSLASRLSYFLWSTMPDAELTDLAAHGQLRANLRPQVQRMLKDPKAEQLSKNFTGQWLQARDIPGVASNNAEILTRDAGEEATWRQLREAWRHNDEATAKKLSEQLDETVFKPKEHLELDWKMRAALQRETEMYFAYVVSEDRPITELIDSNYAFLNDKLAKLYGLAPVEGSELRKVTLPAGNPRGGVLTQGNALVVTSNPDRTSPVKRGLFVLSNFLGTPPPPPPPNIPALEASETGNDGHEPTLRESLTKHRENPTCASCHNRMDPIGLAFENFNAMGMWRDSERKQPIVAPGQLITGETFGSVSELKRILATGHREEFYRTLTDKMLTYAMGRGTEYYDVETIDRIVKQLDDNQGRFSVMLLGVIESAPFQKMRTQATAAVNN